MQTPFHSRGDYSPIPFYIHKYRLENIKEQDKNHNKMAETKYSNYSREKNSYSLNSCITGCKRRHDGTL